MAEETKVTVEEIRETMDRLRDKLHAERTHWMERVHQLKESEAQAREQAERVRNLNLILSAAMAKVCQAYGQKKGVDYVLDILEPKQKRGCVWAATVEPLKDEHSWRIRCRSIKLPEEEKENG